MFSGKTPEAYWSARIRRGLRGKYVMIKVVDWLGVELRIRVSRRQFRHMRDDFAQCGEHWVNPSLCIVAHEGHYEARYDQTWVHPTARKGFLDKYTVKIKREWLDKHLG